MSNPKEKAKELFLKFRQIPPYSPYTGIDDGEAKQCALIAVQEIMRVCPYIDSKIRETEDQLSAFDFQFVSYWQEVKQELQRL